MNISEIYFEGFRNLHDAVIVPDKGINVIFGKNAQGKTNLLEGIWLLSGNKSFRGVRDSNLIKFGCDHARICSKFFSEDREQSSEIIFWGSKKEVKLNGINQKSVTSLIGKLCLVVFSPEHLSLVKDGPKERRKFLDTAICQIKPSYAELISKYNKTLMQRNALLKDIPEHMGLLDTLDVWDYRLSVLGANIVRTRLNYVQHLESCAKKYHLGISAGKEEISLRYLCELPDEQCGSSANVKDAIEEKLKAGRQIDLRDGFTSFGPHKDDLEVTINGVNVRNFGSQGQQRSCVVSMKIAEAELMKKATEQEPIILLDDVLSELDITRQMFLLNEINNRQVFITCCEAASAERLKSGLLMQISNGSCLLRPQDTAFDSF